MGNRLYYEDPYLAEIEAEVTQVDEKGFYLDKTIFYPECGGQRGDSGFFGPYRVETTIPGKDGEPLHVVSGSLPQVGEKHILTLDWDKRYFSMIEHTAQHLISSVLYNSFSIATVAVHHGEDEITIETDKNVLPQEILLETEEKVIKLITENRKVCSLEVTREDALSLPLRRTIKVDSDRVRVVFIEKEDITPCGGVHIASLGEIEEALYVGSESIRGHIRTIWRVGKKSRERRRENSYIVSSLKKKFSAEGEAIIHEGERLIEENRILKKENKTLVQALSKLEFEKQKGDIIVYMTHYPLDSLLDIASEKGKRIFILGEGNTFLFVGEKDSFNALKEKFELRGGGREPLFRGTSDLLDSSMLGQIKSFLASL